MHGPVVAAEFGELPGAVERIDDPYPLGGQPCRVVDTFFGQDHVIGPRYTQFRHQKIMGPIVTGGFSLLGGRPGQLFAHRQEQRTGAGGQVGGKLMVGHAPLPSRSITCCASSSGCAPW